jgi:hypothetical protein
MVTLSSGNIETNGTGMLQVDFANKLVKHNYKLADFLQNSTLF